MPDEVTLDVTTIEENVTVETTAGDVVEIQVLAPTGATGPAGPNSVTSATTSNGTANLTLNNVSTVSFTAGNSSTTSGEITIFTNGPVFQWRSDTVEYGEKGFTFLTTDITSEVNYTLPNATGTIALTTSNVATATALQNSRNIFGIAFNGTANVAGDATNTGHFASIPTSGQAGHFVTLNGTAPTVVAGRSAWWSDGSGNPSFRNGTGTAVTLVKSSDLGTNVATFLETPTSANLASALTDENGTGGGFVRAEGASLTTPTLVGTPVFNAMAYTYGTGAAAAHRTALGVTSTQLQTESLFSLLTLQESDAGVYTANAGTATASQDGDSLSLSATTANQRPNVYRFRNWNKNPGVSGTANAVIPVRLACAGNIYHLGSGANGASFRCGFGMVNGASAVAADANATTGRGFGWRIAWNSSTSKLEFNLWAHNGTTYVEGTGIDTGLGAGNLDGIFNIIVGLASDGTVSANTWFGSSTSTSAVPSSTPTVTLAGGPTSGTFANLGTPSWIAAAHSTNAPASGNSIITRISNRKLALG